MDPTRALYIDAYSRGGFRGGSWGAHDPPLPMLHAKIFENRCDVLIIMHDVSAYNDVD